MWWHVTVLSAIWFGDIYSGTFVGLIDSEPTLNNPCFSLPMWVVSLIFQACFYNKMTGCELVQLPLETVQIVIKAHLYWYTEGSELVFKSTGELIFIGERVKGYLYRLNLYVSS